VERFTREEAAYWLSGMTTFSPDARPWALAGMRILVGGHAKDAGVERMLQRLKSYLAAVLNAMVRAFV
jgi:hypothetical protein